ncbi:hypothetical protein HDU96_008071 [Phlyctochytrium bullatum]|nr:hypothetical protein HDU96_008071 [Phlyctochytrium bullatum]
MGSEVYLTTDKDTVAAYNSADHMPELPEVERARLLLHETCVGHKVTEVKSMPDSIVFAGKNNFTNDTFAAGLTNKQVTDTYRYGKVFCLKMSEPPHAVLHLGMTGSVRVKGKPGLKYMDFKTDGDEWPPRFWKFVLVLSNGVEVAFTDPRRLARVRLAEDPVKEPPISELGFDPIHSMPSLESFSESIRKRSVPVKALLLDQSFSAGVGNWVADEVLYNAKIHPAQRTQTLLDTELQALHESIQHVIRTACDVNADSDQFPPTWLFHYRWDKAKSKKERLLMPNGNPIAFITVGGRTTAVVPAEQKLRGEMQVPAGKKKKRGEDKSSRDEAGLEEEEDAAEEEKEAKPVKTKKQVKRKSDKEAKPAKPSKRAKGKGDDQTQQAEEVGTGVVKSEEKKKSKAQDAQESEYALLLKQALAPAVRLELYPKSEIDVFVYIIEADGALPALASAICCASLALADAGVEMYDTVAACSAGFFEGKSKNIEERAFALDCTKEEESHQIGSLMLAYMPSLKEITHMIHTGEVGVTPITEAMDLCVDGCTKIHEALRQILVTGMEERLKRERAAKEKAQSNDVDKMVE